MRHNKDEDLAIRMIAQVKSVRPQDTVRLDTEAGNCDAGRLDNRQELLSANY